MNIPSFKYSQKEGENMFKIFNKSKVDFVVVGLGNPGNKYENTRHNVGFLAIDHIAAEKNISSKKIKHNSEIFEATIAEKHVLLVKPLTYMNLSGDAVEEIVSYYKIPIENVIVISDDISLATGKLRIRRKGSDGGHNGLKDIIFKTGSDEFPRIKIGIGSKPNNWDLSNWVLSKFSESDREKIDLAIKNVCQALDLLITGKINDAMNKFNS